MLKAILESILHPDELLALVQYKMSFSSKEIKYKSESLKKCFEFLKLTSRSFAAVIEELDEELKSAVCIFYLVLRALDTIEDDMTLDPDMKTKHLINFHTYLTQPGWCFMESGPNEADRFLLQEFNNVITEFLALAPPFQDVISDITRQMGAGMAHFVSVHEISTLTAWNQYCYYVAGLVGIGLSRIFTASGLEDESIAENERISNDMGLFLQKTNIIRDYYDDIIDGRTFWPREVWSLYADSLGDFKELKNRHQALHCLNHLITDALALVPSVFSYLKNIRNPSVFAFCAIPQVMAIATLALCYNNEGVFKGCVKIRKGLAVKLISQATSMDEVYRIFSKFAMELSQKVQDADPSCDETRHQLKIILKESSYSSVHVPSLRDNTIHSSSTLWSPKLLVVLCVTYLLYSAVEARVRL